MNGILWKKQRTAFWNVIDRFEQRGITSRIACELIQFAIDKNIIEEYSYYRKPAYRLLIEQTEIICSSKYQKDMIVEEQVEEVKIANDERLAQYMNDWDIFDETLVTNETIVLPCTPATPLSITTLL